MTTFTITGQREDDEYSGCVSLFVQALLIARETPTYAVPAAWIVHRAVRAPGASPMSTVLLQRGILPALTEEGKHFYFGKSLRKAFPFGKSEESFPLRKVFEKSFPFRKSLRKAFPFGKSLRKAFPSGKSLRKTYPLGKSLRTTFP